MNEPRVTALFCRAHTMRPGLFTGQTVNAFRGSLSRYPCGPGYLGHCLKCSRCGYSITTGPRRDE